MTPSLLYQRHGNLVLIVQTERPPADEDWAGYVNLYRRGWHRYNQCRILVLSAGGSPTNLQQRQVNELVPGIAVRVAVVALAPSVAQIVRRLIIVNDAMQLFSPDELDQAMAFLDVADAERPMVREALAAMQAELGL
jgi:hypothetical protein